MTKTCRQCGIEQTIDSFYSYTDKRNGNIRTQSLCKKCDHQRLREREHSNPERTKEYYRNRYAKNKDHIKERYGKWAGENEEKVRGYKRRYHLMKKYGITPEDVYAMIESQGCKCAICGEKKTNLVVDHDHDTMAVRAMLCQSCNVFVGYLETHQYMLVDSVRYIMKHKGIPEKLVLFAR